MHAARIAWTTAIGSTLGGCVAAPQMHGPLPVRNQHPAQLTVMHMPPAASRTLAADAWAARVDLAYSSLLLGDASASGTSSFHMDGEYLRVGPQVRTGLGGGFELAVEVPFAHTSGGFLDSFLIDYHDTLGLPDQDRSRIPKDQFEVTAVDQGQSAWGVEPSSLELLDLPVWLTYPLADARDGLGVALRAGFELPTGDDEQGYGNGDLDYSAGVLLEHHLGGIALYGHAQHTFASTPDQSDAAGLEFADVTSLGLAAELPFAAHWNALVQVEFETSTLRHLELASTDRNQVLLWLGVRWHCGERWALEAALGEDLQTSASPDFTAWIGFTTVQPAAGSGGAR